MRASAQNRNAKILDRHHPVIGHQRAIRLTIVPKLRICQRRQVGMKCQAPVNIPFFLYHLVKLRKEILGIDHTIMFPILLGMIPVPVMIQTDEHPRVGISTLDRIVRHPENLHILPDELFLVHIGNIAPFTDIHFISDDIILSRSV